MLVHDISNRRQLEETLEEQESLLQTIFETEPECVKLIDSSGVVLKMNRAGLEMVEADSPEQIVGQCLYPLVARQYREAFQDLTRRTFLGKSDKLEFEIIGIKGTRLWLETHAVPLRNKKGDITSSLSITRDISERKRMEDALHRSEQWTRSLVETAGIVILCLSTEHRILEWNPEAERVYGCKRDQVLGKDYLELFLPEEARDALPKRSSRCWPEDPAKALRTRFNAATAVSASFSGMPSEYWTSRGFRWALSVAAWILRIRSG